jgi:hypothetical protein
VLLRVEHRSLNALVADAEEHRCALSLASIHRFAGRFRPVRAVK